MGNLIINQKLQELMRGYPTVSDKYDVRGATLAKTSEAGHFGDIVKFNADGFFTVASKTNTIGSANEVAGVLLATNVKVPGVWPANYTVDVLTKPGEAFNLMVWGYVALPVEVAGTESAEPTLEQLKAALAGIHEGDDAKITANGKVSKTGTIDLGWKFTGSAELVDGELLAGVFVPQKNC